MKNLFYMGNYQMAINEATQGDFSGASKTELDCLVNRSYIGMGNFAVGNTSPVLSVWAADHSRAARSWWPATLTTTLPWTYWQSECWRIICPQGCESPVRLS